MIGKQIEKPVSDWQEYTQAALWCNAHRAMIEDRDDCYEIVALPEPPEPTLEGVRKQKRAELHAAFEAALKEAHCLSSLGFEIDVDSVAGRNVSGLIATMDATGEETVRFRAFDNTFHETSRDQLKIMQLEIVSYAQAMYETKWVWEERIDAAETIEELNALEMNFSGRGNDGTAAGV